MTITILYFAAVRELVGRDEERVVLPPNVGTIGALAGFLEAHRPSLAGRLKAVRFARNETFATNDEPLSDGDTVALIPPVAGG
ncbi:MAG: Molybdenum cofactor biosynthesis protein MoaD / Molybdenum cofactor biosynthesis protein MoaE [Labilithrix sp.]|nr:Molybdenum cofactor biosynthesis protein MoaD / Molybdenum cofactor biosynthesis protein MoaE [Labilithrix sp.]